MRPTTVVGVLLIVLGVAMLVTGGYSYQKSDKVLDAGTAAGVSDARQARQHSAARRRRRARRGRRVDVRRQQAANLAVQSAKC